MTLADSHLCVIQNLAFRLHLVQWRLNKLVAEYIVLLLIAILILDMDALLQAEKAEPVKSL